MIEPAGRIRPASPTVVRDRSMRFLEYAVATLAAVGAILLALTR